MSNSLAVAATTATLRNLLLAGVRQRDVDLADLDVTTRAPDAARTNVSSSSLNLFLYRTDVNSGLSNQDPPRSVKPGESGYPPLALDLHYLLTPFGRDLLDKDVVSHRVLGAAMGVLHDHPVLGADEIRSSLLGNDLAGQAERLRITPLPLGVDDLSKLWGAFQSQYRMSVAYLVTVVLIDSRRTVRAPLPVLNRGAGDPGPVAVAGAVPVLRALVPPNTQAAARLGEDCVLGGDHLDGNPLLHFTSTLTDSPPSVDVQRRPPAAGEPAGTFVVRIPDTTIDPDVFASWVPGPYVVTAVLNPTGLNPTGLPTLVSNTVGFALAPTATVTPNADEHATVAPGGVITMTCAPRVRADQRVQLVLGDALIEPASRSAPFPAPPGETTPSSFTFTVPPVAPGTYVARLRVDGVDSVPVTYRPDPATGRLVPAFDPKQQVEVVA